MVSYYGQAEQPNYNQGAMPLHIEPLHSGERSALSNMLGVGVGDGLAGGGGMVDAQRMQRDLMSNPSQAAANYTSPQVMQFMQTGQQSLNNANSAVQSGLRGYVQADVDKYFNPYTEQVINRNNAALTSQGEKAMAALLAQEGQRGARSFGGSMTARRMSDLENDLLDRRADMDANLRYQGFNDAVANMNNERSRSLQGAQIYNQNASIANQGAANAQNISNSALDMAGRDIGTLFDMGRQQTAQFERNRLNQLGAGNTIRTFNQSIADYVAQDMLNEQNYPRENLRNTLSLLPSFQSNIGSTPLRNNDLGEIGAVLDLGFKAASGGGLI